MKIIICLFFLQILFLNISFSQTSFSPPSLAFQQISDGLSQNQISDIIQDHQGYIWAATYSGINRYDGIGFQIFEYNKEDSTSLPSNRISQFFEDSQQQLWVATLTGGLARFNREANNFETWQPIKGDINSLSNHIVFCISEDSKGNLWVGTAYGLNKIDSERKNISHFGIDGNIQFLGKEITGLSEDTKGRIWVGTFGGINLFDPNENKLITPLNTDGKKLEIGAVSKIYKDSKGNMWVGTSDKGVYLLEEKTNNKFQVTHFPHDPAIEESIGSNRIRAILEDSEGNIWVGAENGGLNIYNPIENDFYTYYPDPEDNLSIKSNSIWAVYEDKAGRLWVGTYNQGLNINDPYYRKFSHKNRTANQSEGLKHNAVSSFLEINGNQLWVGSDGGGITIWDREKNTYKYHQHDKENPKSLGSNAVLDIAQISDSSIWVTTWAGGLNQYDPETNGFRKYLHNPDDPQSIANNHVFGLQEDKNGDLWMGVFHGGVCRLDRKTGRFTTIPVDPNNENALTSDIIFGLTIDSKGDIWVPTVTGLNKITLKNNDEYTIKKYLENSKNPLAISTNTVNLVTEDSKKRLWIGTSSGLNLYLPEKDGFKVYGKKEGLPNETIQGIIEDKNGIIWITTNKGISKITEDKEGNFTFRNYDKSDGLQGDEFTRNACYMNAKGELFLGGTNGFNYFNPDNVIDNPFEPQIQISNFKLFNKDVAIGTVDSPLKKHISATQELTLTHEQSVFSLEFIGLNLTHSYKNQYAYMLEGLEDDWNYVGDLKTATYTNLNAGEYIFKVKAANNDGVWNEEGIELKIIILPPWWETWWFRGILLAISIGLIVAFYNYRTYQLKEQKRKLEDQVEKRTAQLKEANEEIQVQNEEMAQQAEELEQQRDYLQEANNLVSHKNEQITASINYAKRIQHSVLPMDEELTEAFSDHFVVFQPRDIVSGDFYWMYESEDQIHIAVVDCTGHGVPGAFMSMIGSSLLNRIVAEMKISDPAEILTELDKLVYRALKQDKSRQSDGMDMVMCAISKTKPNEKIKVQFAGAKNDLFIISKDKREIEVLPGDRISIGGTINTKRHFQTNEVLLERDSLIYLTTDGFIDQHRPSDRRRLGSKKLKAFLEEIKENPLSKQKLLLEEFLNNYMEDASQRDDVAFIGIKI